MQTDVETLLKFTNKFYRGKNKGRPANVMLKGETQSGKTMLVEILAVAVVRDAWPAQGHAGLHAERVRPVSPTSTCSVR